MQFGQWLGGLASLAIGSVASAAIISGETSTSSSDIPGFNRGHLLAVNDSGLSAGDGSLATPDVTHVVAPDGNMWLSSGAGFGGIDPAPFFQVDLGADYTLTGSRFWNYNEAGGPGGDPFDRGIKSAHITFTNALGTVIDGGTINFNEASGTGNETGQFFDLSAIPIPVRFIKLDSLVNYGSTEGFFGISEIQFEGTPVPEPASLGLLAIAVPGVLRRRGHRRG